MLTFRTRVLIQLLRYLVVYLMITFDYLGLYYFLAHHSFSDPVVVNDLAGTIIDGIHNFIPKITDILIGILAGFQLS